MKLLDASVAAKFAVDEEGFEAARALTSQSLCAPELILSETANAWWKAHRRGALSANAVETAVANLAGLFDDLLPLSAVLESATALALKLDHPVYDCVYLAFARRLETPVITADRRLLNKIGGTEYHSLCEALEA